MPYAAGDGEDLPPHLSPDGHVSINVDSGH